MDRIIDYGDAKCPKHPRRAIHHSSFKVSNWHVPSQFITLNLTHDELQSRYNPYSDLRGVALSDAVRDPYSHFVSDYRYTTRERFHNPHHLNEYTVKLLRTLHNGKKPGPVYFIHDAHFVSEYDYLKALHGFIALHVLRTEQLVMDWACLVRRYGLPLEMANIGTTNRNPGSSPETI